MNVYNEVKLGNYIYRTFEPDSLEDDLVWHRDKSDRKVLIISGAGWMFQFDNELPVKLNEGETIIIKADVYHRLIKQKNSTHLIIRIEEG